MSVHPWWSSWDVPKPAFLILQLWLSVCVGLVRVYPSQWCCDPASLVFSRLLQDFTPRSLRPLVGWLVGLLFAFWPFFSFLSSLLLPKCPAPGDLFYHCPCPPACAWGSRVSGLVLVLFIFLCFFLPILGILSFSLSFFVCLFLSFFVSFFLSFFLSFFPCQGFAHSPNSFAKLGGARCWLVDRFASATAVIMSRQLVSICLFWYAAQNNFIWLYLKI